MLSLKNVPKYASWSRELGYQPVEINASDTRNKADSKITGGMAGKLANAVKEMTTNTAIGTDQRGQRKRVCNPPYYTVLQQKASQRMSPLPA